MEAWRDARADLLKLQEKAGITTIGASSPCGSENERKRGIPGGYCLADPILDGKLLLGLFFRASTEIRLGISIVGRVHSHG